MSGSEAERTALTAAALVERYGGIAPFFRRVGIGGVLYALILQAIQAIGAAGSFLLAPWRAAADGLAELVEGTIGGSVDLIDAGILAGVRSFEGTLGQLVGPLAFPIAVIVIMVTIYIFVWFIGQIPFSPLEFVRSRG